MNRFLSLRFRLIASIVVIEIIMLSILVLTNLNSIYQINLDRLNHTANSMVKQFSATAGSYITEVDYAGLEEFAKNFLSQPELSYLVVLDNEGNTLVHLGAETPGILAGEFESGPDKVIDGVFDIQSDILLAGRAQGRVIMGFSLSRMQNDIVTARNRSILIAGTAVLLTILITVLLGVYMTGGLKMLSEAASHVANGHYDIKLPVARNDEIGIAASAFNDMVDAINKYTERVEEDQQQIKLLMDSVSEAIYGVDLDGVCTFVNQSCVKMLGYQDERDLLGKSIHELIHHTYPDGTHYPKAECSVRLATLQGRDQHKDDEVHWRADGSSFPIEYWSHPIHRHGDIIGTVVAFIDITERKKAEAELQEYRDHLESLVDERTSELTRLNKELESFTHTISHDLRAPLRSIKDQSMAIIDRYEDMLDETCQHYFNGIWNDSHKMSKLIDDILELSRVSSGKITRSPVDLSAMVNQIMVHLQEADPDREIVLDIMPDVVCDADEGLLQIGMNNLLSNAWKYSQNSPQSRIEFGMESRNDSKVFYVKDNGAGFDMQYVAKLFKPFQRLHGDDEFEGTGIGLATVARVISRHKGKIWAESEIGKGATFYFTLPG